MTRLLTALLTALLITACGRAPDETVVGSETAYGPTLPKGVTLIETFTGSDAEFSIPFSKFVLDNGLTVILHEDHSDPMVHVDVTYHVGSAREEIGRSGFAHFFEHMMFEGSKNVGRGNSRK